jgi:hypothetical protein
MPLTHPFSSPPLLGAADRAGLAEPRYALATCEEDTDGESPWRLSPCSTLNALELLMLACSSGVDGALLEDASWPPSPASRRLADMALMALTGAGQGDRQPRSQSRCFFCRSMAWANSH